MASSALSRDAFVSAVLKRDQGKCVVCKTPSACVHHLIDRQLWNDGGNHVDNGVTVCEPCHWDAETTKLSPSQLRALANITNVVVPDTLDPADEHDKWGNTIMPDGTRLKGPLAHDPSVRALLERHGMWSLLRPWSKYPKTMHLPWSQGLQNDDRLMASQERWHQQDVVVTEKMDGENTTLYRDHIHARSLDSANHPSRNWVKALWGSICHDIPEGWRICGENCYAKHSVGYDRLPSYFLVFSMWNDKQECLSWEQTVQWCQLLDLTPVPVLYEGVYDPQAIQALWTPERAMTSEGYVVRPAGMFRAHEFSSVVGKFVRKGHVQTNKHWMSQAIEPNQLASRPSKPSP